MIVSKPCFPESFFSLCDLFLSPVYSEFAPLFLQRDPVEAQFDALLRVRVTPAVAKVYGPQLLDRGDWAAFARHFILTVLKQGSATTHLDPINIFFLI
jgi:hypothetical protein